MKALWSRTFELFRGHILLWVPCSVAGILMLALGRLEKAGINWLSRFLSTQHSVLGGEVPWTNLAQVQHRTMMVVYPLEYFKQFLEVCLFVAALAITKNLVHMVLDEQRPGMIAAVRGITPRWREVLLFSLKYMAVLAVFGGVLIALASFPFTSQTFGEIASSKVCLYVYGLVAEFCLAWLLVPAALRLLRLPENSTVTAQERKVGTAFAVATSAGSLALEYLLGKAEITVIFDNPWEGLAIAIVNTIIINAMQVLLFIALALLAIQGMGEHASLAAAPELS